MAGDEKGFTVMLVSMGISFTKTAATPIGCWKRYANTFLGWSRHVSRSAGFCGVASTMSYIIMYISSRMLTLLTFGDLLSSSLGIENISISDSLANILQWALPSHDHPRRGYSATNTIMTTVEGRLEPYYKLVQSGSCICTVLIL